MFLLKWISTIWAVYLFILYVFFFSLLLRRRRCCCCCSLPQSNMKWNCTEMTIYQLTPFTVCIFGIITINRRFDKQPGYRNFVKFLRQLNGSSKIFRIFYTYLKVWLSIKWWVAAIQPDKERRTRIHREKIAIIISFSQLFARIYWCVCMCILQFVLWLWYNFKRRTRCLITRPLLLLCASLSEWHFDHSQMISYEAKRSKQIKNNLTIAAKRFCCCGFCRRFQTWCIKYNLWPG